MLFKLKLVWIFVSVWIALIQIQIIRCVTMDPDTPLLNKTAYDG